MDPATVQVNAETEHDLSELLLSELRWIGTLRWAAGLAVIVFDLVQWRWLGWYDHPGMILAIGLVVLAFNAVMTGWILAGDRLLRSPGLPKAMAVLAIVFDLTCLTALAALTDGAASPVAGLFVLHMVFAATLLTGMSVLAALLAIAMFLAMLTVTGQWPTERDHGLLLAGWGLTLVATVHLARRLALRLQWRERRLIESNREIRAMSDRLKDQQEAMIQHDKMVAMGRLAAGVAHEIANPLASMDSVLQLMQRHPERPRVDAIGDLREQVRRIHGIVRGMTTFAHPDQGAIGTHDLNEVVRASLDMLRFDKRLRDAKVDTSLSTDIGPARINPHALQQVLINIVLNALDATEGQDRAHLSIRTTKDNGRCTIEITDNGHGIPADIQHRIFDPFFTTKPAGQGTGLGLSISYRLVQHQGGQLEVESEPGRTVFRVHLPTPTVGESAGSVHDEED